MIAPPGRAWGRVDDGGASKHTPRPKVANMHCPKTTGCLLRMQPELSTTHSARTAHIHFATKSGMG